MTILRRFALWLVFFGPIPLGRLGPYVLGFALGSKPIQIEDRK